MKRNRRRNKKLKYEILEKSKWEAKIALYCETLGKPLEKTVIRLKRNIPINSFSIQDLGEISHLIKAKWIKERNKLNRKWKKPRWRKLQNFMRAIRDCKESFHNVHVPDHHMTCLPIWQFYVSICTSIELNKLKKTLINGETNLISG